MGKITINADILTNNTEKTCEFSGSIILVGVKKTPTIFYIK